MDGNDKHTALPVFPYSAENEPMAAARKEYAAFSRLLNAVKRELDAGINSPVCVHIVEAVAADCLARRKTSLEALVRQQESKAPGSAAAERLAAYCDAAAAKSRSRFVYCKGGSKMAWSFNAKDVLSTVSNANVRIATLTRAAMTQPPACASAIEASGAFDAVCAAAGVWFSLLDGLNVQVENITSENGSAAFFERSCVDLYVSADDKAEARVAGYYKQFEEYMLALQYCAAWLLDGVRTADDFVNPQKHEEFRRLAAGVAKEFNDTVECEKVCRDIVTTRMKADAEAIGRRFARIMPKVPGAAHPGYSCPTVAVGEWLRADERMLSQKKLATVSLSSVFAAAQRTGVSRRIFTLEQLVAWGLVSRDAEAALVVDDGYLYRQQERKLSTKAWQEVFDDLQAIYRKAGSSRDAHTALNKVFFTTEAMSLLNAVLLNK